MRGFDDCSEMYTFCKIDPPRPPLSQPIRSSESDHPYTFSDIIMSMFCPEHSAYVVGDKSSSATF